MQLGLPSLACPASHRRRSSSRCLLTASTPAALTFAEATADKPARRRCRQRWCQVSNVPSRCWWTSGACRTSTPSGSTTRSPRRASSRRVTGCGRSISGGSVGSARWRRTSGRRTSRATAWRARCCSAAACIASGSRTPPMPSASPRRSWPASTRTSTSRIASRSCCRRSSASSATARRAGTPSDIVRIRHHGLTLNLTNEIDRAEVYCKDGPAAPRVDWLRRALVPEITPALAPGLDPCALPFAQLRQAYALATARPQFLSGRSCGQCAMRQATARRAVPTGGRAGVEQLGRGAFPQRHGPAHPGERSAPRARGAEPPLHQPPRRAGARRHRRRRAIPPRHLDRPQRGDGVRADAVLHGSGGSLRLRDQPRSARRVPVPGALGADADDHGTHRGAGRGAAHGDPGVHAPRAGARDRHGRASRVRAARGLAGRGHGAVLRGHRVHARPHLGPVRRGHEPLGRARARTRCTPTPAATSAGFRRASPSCGPTGTGSRRCLATDATSGPGTATWTNCRAPSIRRPAT